MKVKGSEDNTVGGVPPKCPDRAALDFSDGWDDAFRVIWEDDSNALICISTTRKVLTKILSNPHQNLLICR